MNRLISVFAFALLVSSLRASAQVDPCKLLTPAEIESVLGVKVPQFTHGSVQGSNTVTCNGDPVKGMSVGMMFAAPKPGDPKIADPMSWIETYSRDSAKAIGAQLNMQRFGSSIICTQLITPKQGLFNTQCYAVKPPNMTAVTVLVPTQQEMVSMDKLRLLAEKMLGRF
ncbi:MAG TPA: hypothetical protein VKL40_10580 [Candidatus Angelobacter sp.]|nr:hypothetical protein [Candidatus Angelobacter sp.]